MYSVRELKYREALLLPRHVELTAVLLDLHNLNAYQIKFFNQLEKRKTCVYTLCIHLIKVIILQGIVLFQSLNFYGDEIPCKQANLLDTDLLVLDVIDDFELSVAVVNACVYYIAGYILSNFKKFTDLN